MTKLDRTSRSALGLSGLLHVGTMWMLSHSWLETPREAPRLAGAQQMAIQLEASFQPERLIAPVVETAMTVEVTPSVAHAFNRTFIDTPAVEHNTFSPHIDSATKVTADVAPAMVRSQTASLATASQAEPTTLPRQATPAPRPPMPLAVPPVVAPNPSLASNQTAPPEYEHTPPPRYPELARQRGWQGTVLMVVKIDSSGRVTSVAIEESSGYQLLDAAAVQAVQRWRYKPAAGRHGPVATEELQPVTFRLPRS